MDRKKYVIAISGFSGSGKSTITKKIAKSFNDSTFIMFDDYQEQTSYPKEMFTGNSKEISMDKLESNCFFNDLDELIDDKDIIYSKHRKINTAKFIIIDWNFGRSHYRVSKSIDKVFFVDVPLDIALSRKILRNIDVDLKNKKPDDKIDIIKSNLTMYLKGFRSANIKIYEKVKNDSDIILDGTKTIDELSNKIIEELKKLEG
ncbi:hypothetical protein SH1V18_01600 [Vallitalea longa]|uniref:Uridine kinase n=1 Tax=Vallitalea longa TaxID=2936439 RepID=A0A9W5Y852_9FIRM|nr:hypothetical protein [Vallitalea longa]GKX27680.1 hypothetical protein SH1V18_01600 [Vallitalea longa]